MRIELVDEFTGDLGRQIVALTGAIRHPNWQFAFPANLVLGWLPDFSASDLGVRNLVAAVDANPVAPQKIVMLSPAGTADDADLDQLISWYGATAPTLLGDALYAVKMVDELELPYTVIRTLPVVRQGGGQKLSPEGEPMQGQATNQAALAHLFGTALQTAQYQNQSIGLGE